MADVTVGVRLAMRILVGFADEGRRRDHSRITGGPRVFRVKVKPIVIANGECEITDRRPSEFLRCSVVELAPDPSLKFVCNAHVAASSLICAPQYAHLADSFARLHFVPPGELGSATLGLAGCGKTYSLYDNSFR